MILGGANTNVEDMEEGSSSVVITQFSRYRFFFLLKLVAKNQFIFFLLKLGGANTNVEDMKFFIKDNKKKKEQF